MRIIASLALVTFSLATSACGGRTGDRPLLPGEVAIEIFNERPTGVRIFLNKEDVGTVSASSMETFIVPEGNYAIAYDLRGDGVTRLIPFQFVGLRSLQRTFATIRTQRGSRPIANNEAAIDFANESPFDVRVFIGGLDLGVVASGSGDRFFAPPGGSGVALDIVGDPFDSPFPFQYVGLQAGDRTFMTYR
jgi:hypothetical protein